MHFQQQTAFPLHWFVWIAGLITEPHGPHIYPTDHKIRPADDSSRFRRFCDGLLSTPPHHILFSTPTSSWKCLGRQGWSLQSTLSKVVLEEQRSWSWCLWAPASWLRREVCLRSLWRAWNRPRVQCFGREPCEGPCLISGLSRPAPRASPHTPLQWGRVWKTNIQDFICLVFRLTWKQILM